MSVDISLEDQNDGGRYIARVQGFDEPGELSFTRKSAQLISADHTFVPESLRGKGVGAALAQRIVADARAKGFKIIPVCTYFRGQWERHPEWGDVIRQP